MIPAELVPRRIQLPEKDGCRIVIFSGNSLRHDRFALRIQNSFGERVVEWFQVIPEASQLSTHPGMWRQTPSQNDVEQRLFEAEVQSLRKSGHLQPMRVSDPNSPEVISKVMSLNPYLILTLGGAIYGKSLLSTTKGLALNQHDGWCPDYKGAGTVDWTLYHRDIARMGSTVHLLTSGMDAGPIVRRSTACLLDDDTRESCFARIVALGTELMCEVVADVIRADHLTVYDQPGDQGFTYLSADLKERVTRAVDRDLRNGFLSFELSRLRKF